MNHQFENPATLAKQHTELGAYLIPLEYQEPVSSAADLPVWVAVFAGAMMLTPIAVLVRQIVKRK